GLATVAAVADAHANGLIIGESGTGKALVADALHERSRRRGGPWVKINCAALPKDLIESELFGHTRGSFTGATSDKTGLLEEADGGSLLLDEITEMPAELQAKLLRVLEERAVRRVGAAKAVPVDFRLISSTNRSPEAALREGRLRQDLFFRINTVSIYVPPLRERREHITILVPAFLERYRTKHRRDVGGIEPEAYRRLRCLAPRRIARFRGRLSRAPPGTAVAMDAAGRVPDEKDRGDHQAVQAGRRQGSAHLHRRDRHDRVGGARLWPAEGPHRALPRRRVHGRFPSHDQDRGRCPRPPRRQGRRRDCRPGQDRQHRGRQ